MGNSSSSKQVRENKLSMAEKTGVLNLANQNLTLSSSVWKTLDHPNYHNKLKTLDLSNNPLSELPSCVVACIQLKSLILNNCKRRSVPTLESLSKLNSLQIDSNSLESSEIAVLPTSLKSLSIMTNRLIEIPHSVLFQRQLTVLNLSHNQIVHIAGVEALSALIELNLSHNELLELPEGLGSLTQLQILLVEDNHLHAKSPSTNDQSIPASVFMNTRLERLELKGNPLKKWELEEFRGIERYIERRKALNDKLFQGGITQLEENLCGLTE